MNALFDLSSPAIDHATITPSDVAVLTQRPRALRIIGEGTLSVRTRVGGEVVNYSVYDGEIIPLQVVQVLTGTDVTVVAWY